MVLNWSLFSAKVLISENRYYMSLFLVLIILFPIYISYRVGYMKFIDSTCIEELFERILMKKVDLTCVGCSKISAERPASPYFQISWSLFGTYFLEIRSLFGP